MALALMFLWIAVCICVVVATVLYCLRTRVLDGRRQAMWFLSGCMVAATAALAWPLLVWGGRSAGCALDSESAVCTLYRYQDWFLLAPLPILLASFVMGLLYRGPIDAARLFRRTAVYGSMLLLSLFVLGAAEALLGDRKTESEVISPSLKSRFGPAMTSTSTSIGTLAPGGRLRTRIV